MTNIVAASIDEQRIREVVDTYEQAWNRHDVDALISLFSEDIEWVNVAGMWWRGLPEVRRGYEWIHQTMLKNVPIYIDSCSVRLLTGEAALSIVTWKKGGFVTPDGKQMPEGKDRMSLHLLKAENRWLIKMGHNTTINIEVQHLDPNRT
jgi:uncharacterized protein (TIGR02246 family)